MFNLGLSLSPRDFRNLFVFPRSMAVGLFSQMILLPLVAFVLIYFSDLDPELKIGIMILSVCPGGITSNLVSYYIRGNVALAISLTVCNAFLSLFTIPFMVNFFNERFVDATTSFNLPFWRTMFEIFIVTIIPAGIGLLINVRYIKWANLFERYLKYLLPVLLAIVFIFKFFAGTDKGGTNMTGADILELAPYVILLNVFSMLVGYIAGLIFKLKKRNIITITVEVGLHNTALALLIAGEKLGNHTMEKPALVYAIFSIFITFIVAWTMMRLKFQGE